VADGEGKGNKTKLPASQFKHESPGGHSVWGFAFQIAGSTLF
jgi:hypothetical protein